VNECSSEREFENSSFPYNLFEIIESAGFISYKNVEHIHIRLCVGSATDVMTKLYFGSIT